MIVPEPGADASAAPAEAQDRLRHYERALRSFFARRARAADVDDMVQEALARFIAAAERREIGFPAAYLFRIAGNLLSDHRRREAWSGTVVDIGDYQEAGAASPEQEDARRLVELQNQLDAALAELPSRCREVFLMRRFRDMTTPEVAAALGISPRMVQKHLTRALAHLYVRLRESVHS